MLLTTRMPEKLEATLKQTNAVQTFGYYSTHGSFTTSNTAGTIGSKVGASPSSCRPTARKASASR